MVTLHGNETSVAPACMQAGSRLLQLPDGSKTPFTCYVTSERNVVGIPDERGFTHIFNLLCPVQQALIIEVKLSSLVILSPCHFFHFSNSQVRGLE